MDDANGMAQNSLAEIREARNQAEFLRDQLSAEYHRVLEEEAMATETASPDPRREQGCEALRKAIHAANRAIESIDQALREIGRVDHEEKR